MNNEIKEILDFKENADYKKISCDEIAILKDYITNLQKEARVNNDLIPYFKNREKEFKKRITNLQQKYQDAINQSIEDHKYASKKEDELLDYKSRIEKAVEYIKEAEEQDFMWMPIFEKELLNILNGDNNE